MNASTLRAAAATLALLLPALAQAHPGHAGHGPELGLAVGAGIAALYAAIRYTARRITAASPR